MRKYYCLVFFIVLKSGAVMYAQDWTEQDSIWLQRVLNGTEKIQLNEATRKAIESGTFIHDPAVVKQLKISPAKTPIVQSFEGITAPESRKTERTPLSELPVSVFKLYDLGQNDSLTGRSQIAMPAGSTATTFNQKTIEELKLLDKFTPRKATVDDKTAIGSGGGSIDFDFENILRTIFWPSHRAKKRNAKNANAWKTYNEGY
jgi:hypothetical protein